LKPLLLGIDIGTTGSKAVLIDASGAVLAEATTEYPMSTPRPGWAEQSPEDWWQATVESIRSVLDRAGTKPADIAGVGLTGQMHGLVLLDGQGQVLRPCIMWNDQRTAKQCEEITRRVGFDRLVQITGKPALTGFTAGKILWVRENEPELYARAQHVLLPKDYVRFRLTGEYAMDVADASGTNLLATGRRTWSEEVAGLLDVPLDWLPRVYECHEVVGRISGAAAKETGLAAGTPVVAGAGDQAAQSLGTGITSPGVVSVTIGTSGVVFAATAGYVFDPTGAMHSYCHAVPQTWHLMGVTLSAGGSLRWLRDTVWQHERSASADIYGLMTAAASKVPAGADGLLFLPYLSGERTPYPDPDARGVFFGLSLRHGREHLTRAVIEGVTFALRDGLELLCRLETRCGRVRVSGGGAKSALWRQVMADVFNVEIAEVNVTQGAAFGAALLAGVGAGVFGSVREACDKTVRETTITLPGADVARYSQYYERYRALYPALLGEFKALARAYGQG